MSSMRNLKAILGEDLVARLHNSHIFIVGVGGIGCELLKVLPKVGVRRLTILDLDIIEETNLNRQFYFHKQDIKKYKAEVAREKVLKLDPSLQIMAICDSIYNSKYDVAFYEQFDCVVAAIDSNRGRRYVGSMCMKAKIPMVDGGTKQYSGQTLSVVRTIYQCHNCLPEIQEHQIFDSCTLRSNPSRPAHCIAYAKNFYDCFFGDGAQGDIRQSEFLPEGSVLNEQDIHRIAVQVFDIVFSERVLPQNQMDRGGIVAKFFPLTFSEAQKMDDIVINPNSTRSQDQQKKQQASPFDEEKLWSIKTYAEKFVKSCANTLLQQQRRPGPLAFQKDDDDCMTFVYCMTSLRTYNFMNRADPGNSHKYLTYYQVKDSAGNIQPAISSTNSIAAAAEILEVLKIIGGAIDRLCMTYFRNYDKDKIKKAYLPSPGLDCKVCSVKCCYVRLECDLAKTTYGQLYDYLNTELLGYGRDLMVLNTKGAWDSVVSSTNHANLGKWLTDGIADTVIDGQFGRAMDVRMGSDKQIPLDLSIYVRDTHGINGIVCTKQGQNKRQVRQSVLEFKRQQFKEHLSNMTEEIKAHGFF